MEPFKADRVSVREARMANALAARHRRQYSASPHQLSLDKISLKGRKGIRTMLNKRALLQDLCRRLETMIKDAQTVRKVSETESRAHKGAMESRYDTFKEEAQALAGGHGKRELHLTEELIQVQELLANDQVLAPANIVRAGAIVRVKDAKGGREIRYLLVTASGGIYLEVDGIEVSSLNSSTPLGRALLRKREGDIVKFAASTHNRELEILDIQ